MPFIFYNKEIISLTDKKCNSKVQSGALDVFDIPIHNEILTPFQKNERKKALFFVSSKKTLDK